MIRGGHRSHLWIQSDPWWLIEGRKNETSLSRGGRGAVEWGCSGRESTRKNVTNRTERAMSALEVGGRRKRERGLASRRVC